jgi:RNA polymerase sigma-70 factor, ECF subfamily
LSITRAANLLIEGVRDCKLGIMATTRPETTESDEQLAALVARRGDSDRARQAAEAAFDRLYKRHGPLLLAFLSSRVRDGDPEDVHQIVWGRVWHNLPDRSRADNFRAWLHQIARNVIIDEARKRRPTPLSSPEVLPDGRDEPADHRLIAEERKKALERCMKDLGPQEAAIVRAKLDGEDYSEICARLGLEPARAHKLFHSAKQQLKTCLERVLG